MIVKLKVHKNSRYDMKKCLKIMVMIFSIVLIKASDTNYSQLVLQGIDALKQLEKTGIGDDLDFTRKDLRYVLNILVSNPGYGYGIKSFANTYTLGILANKPFKVSLKNANLEGADLSGIDLSE